MKLKKLSVAAMSTLAIAALLFTVSCKKSNSSPSSSGAMSGKLGDSSFTGTNAGSFYSQSGGYFLVNGLMSKSSTDSVVMQLFLSLPLQVNVIVNMDTTTDDAIDLFDFNVATLNWKTCFSSQNANANGYYKITTYDSVNHRLAGSFYGSLYESNVANDSLLLSNGQFNVTYTVEP